jgi:hypothetical protein
MELEQKIQLLSLVFQKIEDTGRFNHFAFIDTFAKNKPELNQSEQLSLLYLLQKQIKATGQQLDYLPFVEQLGLKIEPVTESLPQSSTHTEPEEPSKVIDATYNDIPQIPESIEIQKVAESPEQQSTIVVYTPPPTQEQVIDVDQLKKRERVNRLNRKLYQQNLLTLVMQQVNHSGRFDYQPFELAQTNYQISPELQLLHRIQQEVERTGRFTYHDFQQNVSNIC